MNCKKFVSLVSVVVLGLVLLAGCQVSPSRSLDAAGDLYKAETLSEQDAKEMGKRIADQYDSDNSVAPASSTYAKRLASLTKDLTNEDGLALNFKVYQVSDVNAFALPDGSIRVFAGLMDIMTDDELFFVIGHEVGHVKEGHSIEGMRTAYRVSAARKAAGATHGVAAAITDSELGDVAESFLNAQFSQSQESASDKYGVKLLKKYNKPVEAGASGLRKLGNTGGGAFASHPNPQDRADAIEKM